ncbi:MAG: hypothetical protein ACLU1X_09925, partial [Peptoniphilus grossensis]
MRTKQLLIYIISIIIYLILVYLLNRRSNKKRIMYGISIISLILFASLKFLGRKYNIEFLGSDKFINTYLNLMCFIINIPILFGGYSTIDFYINKKNFKDNQAFIIKSIMLLILLFLVYISYT